VLLSMLAGDREVGIYQVAFKIIFALQFLPAAFSASLYPALSTYWARNREQLAITFERAMNYLLIISLPIAIGIASIADKVVVLFKAGYGNAVIPLQINMVALTFIFLNYAAGAMLAACDRQKTIMVISGVVTAFSVALNLILIPKFQATGATITVASTNFLMFAANIYYATRIVRFNYKRVGKMLVQVAAAALLMGAATFYLKPFLNVFLTVGIAGILYFSLLFLFGGFKKEDIVSIWQSFKKESVGENINVE
jgi:O-antigen/teichoic acid export membrane protein